MKPLSVGLNCATGPEFMRDHIRSLSDLSECYIFVIQMQVFLMKMDITMNLHLLAEKVKRFAEEGWVNIIGGCCGTTPEHIKAMKSALASLSLVTIMREKDMELVD